LQHRVKTPSKYFQRQHFGDNWQRERGKQVRIRRAFLEKQLENLLFANYEDKNGRTAARFLLSK